MQHLTYKVRLQDGTEGACYSFLSAAKLIGETAGIQTKDGIVEGIISEVLESNVCDIEEML